MYLFNNILYSLLDLFFSENGLDLRTESAAIFFYDFIGVIGDRLIRTTTSKHPIFEEMNKCKGGIGYHICLLALFNFKIEEFRQLCHFWAAFLQPGSKSAHCCLIEFQRH